jgi:ubiquinone/menaquinone biosynthesis C-methylase UbiE
MLRRNLWKNKLVAIAYSYQQKANPYVELIETTEHYISAKAGESWLDLGCGSGRLIESIWKRSCGEVHKIVGLDISLASLLIAQKNLEKLKNGAPCAKKLDFVQADFSVGLGNFRPASFDGISAGLSLSYAQHWDPIDGKWDRAALVGLMGDIYSILRDGGRLVFSVNVPQPDFALIALRSWKQIFFTWKAPLHLAVSVIMLVQSCWLKYGAKRGRFHYLPAAEVVKQLEAAGFKDIKYTLTYAGQAWLFSAVKNPQ